MDSIGSISLIIPGAEAHTLVGEEAEKTEGSGRKDILQREITEMEKEIENKLRIVGTEVRSALLIKEQKTHDEYSMKIKKNLQEIMNLEKLIFRKELQLKRAE